jgi:hypothetical protein
MKQFLGGLTLSVLLIAPVAVRAQGHEGTNQQEHDRMYQDRSHRDSHAWNADEDRAYRQYLQERRMRYHEFTRANQREQEDYWRWRHEHMDRDRDHDRDHDRDRR